jgi:hypothetical protein
MKFYSKSILFLLFLSTGKELFCETGNPVKKLSEYDEFVLTNRLLQDINALLEGKSEPEKKRIMEYFYGEINAVTFNNSTAYADHTIVHNIKAQIQKLPFLTFREAEELQHLTSACLKSLLGRGVSCGLNTILKCFRLAENRLKDGKYNE